MRESERSMDTNMYHRPSAAAKTGMGGSDVLEARFRRFLKDLESYERHQIFERTLDSFLDVYSQWRKTRKDDLKLRLVMLAFELSRLDSGFECDLSFKEAGACGK